MNQYRQNYKPQPSEIEGRRRRQFKSRHFWLLAVAIGFLSLTIILFWGVLTAAHGAEPTPEAKFEAKEDVYDPKGMCGLNDVICPEEASIGTFTVTAYTSRVAETDDTPCISADGSDICKRHAQGETICAANDFPLGTKLTLDVSGGITCTVRDRMNRRYTGKHHIDLYFGHDLKGARQFGSQKIEASYFKT